MNKTIVPTMDEIEAEYKHRLAALIRPASLFLSYTPPRTPVLTNATVKVAQAELQLAKSKMAALEAKAEQSESKMFSIKTLMQSMVKPCKVSKILCLQVLLIVGKVQTLPVAQVLGQLGHQSPGTVLVVNGQAQARAVVR